MDPRGSTRSSATGGWVCGRRAGDQAHAVGRASRDGAEALATRPRWPTPRPELKPETSSSATSDQCEEIDRRYVGDITYVATWEGWAYLATVIDLASRKIVGWSLADHMRTELVEDALTMAFANRAPEKGVIFHSDRGCQYTSKDFADLARKNGVVLCAISEIRVL